MRQYEAPERRGKPQQAALIGGGTTASDASSRLQEHPLRRGRARTRFTQPSAAGRNSAKYRLVPSWPANSRGRQCLTSGALAFRSQRREPHRTRPRAHTLCIARTTWCVSAGRRASPWQRAPTSSWSRCSASALNQADSHAAADTSGVCGPRSGRHSVCQHVRHSQPEQVERNECALAGFMAEPVEPEHEVGVGESSCAAHAVRTSLCGPSCWHWLSY